MTGHVRWGVLGASKFAREQMAPAIHLAAGGKLAALATSSATKAEPFQEINPDLTVHLEYDALLNDPDIDAVYIPLPNHLHLEMSKKAIAAGKHVLCEKPMTLAASEFDELIALRDQTGLVVAEAYMILHHPQWQRAHYLVEDGAIGALQEVRGFFAYNNAADPGNIRNSPAAGGGGIPDIGVYTYGATRYISGQDPQEILHTDVRFEKGVDVYAEVVAQFDGFTAHLVNSMRMQPFQEMTFHGSEGVLRLTAPFNPQIYDGARIELHQPGLGLRVERFPSANHYVNQVEAFNASVLDGTNYPVPLEFSKGTQTMIDMVFAAAS